MRRLTIAAVLAVAAVGVAAPVPAAPARRQTVDWTRQFATMSSGSYVMGNPRARVKLVEYLSLTCSHCAAFSAEAMPALKRDYIARGQVSVEIRNAIRDGFDFSGVILARCQGPAGYFATSERILATQATWLPKADAFLRSAPPMAGEAVTARAEAFARAAGFDALMRGRGMAPARVTACLADAPARDRVVAMAAEAWQQRRIPGTPAFLINGVLQVGVSDWAALRPKIDAALR